MMAPQAPAPSKARQLEDERGARPVVITDQKELREAIKPEEGYTPIPNKIGSHHRIVQLHEKGPDGKDRTAMVTAFSAYYEEPNQIGAKWHTVNFDRMGAVLMDEQTFALLNGQSFTLLKDTKHGILRFDVKTEPDKTKEFTVGGTPLCAYCSRNAGTEQCSGCKLVRYCGQFCQRKHWTEQHGGVCAKLASSMLSQPPKHTGMTPEQMRKLGAVSAAQLGIKPAEPMQL
jgi:hypothetical protein